MLTHKGTQEIRTERLILRRFSLDDAQAMYDNWASDPEVTKFLTWPAHSNVEATQKILESWISEYNRANYYHWAIVQRDGHDEPIGSIIAVIGDDKIQKAHIGYCIGKNWWHKGIMSETLFAVIAFFFTEVGINRVEARHDANNPHSGAVMRKCGMRYEGTSRQSDWNNQGICDTCHYAILKSDWKK